MPDFFKVRQAKLTTFLVTALELVDNTGQAQCFSELARYKTFLAHDGFAVHPAGQYIAQGPGRFKCCVSVECFISHAGYPQWFAHG